MSLENSRTVHTLKTRLAFIGEAIAPVRQSYWYSLYFTSHSPNHARFQALNGQHRRVQDSDRGKRGYMVGGRDIRTRGATFGQKNRSDGQLCDVVITLDTLANIRILDGGGGIRSDVSGGAIDFSEGAED